MSKRVITNTNLHFTRADGRKLSMGEGLAYEIYSIKGLGIGEIERESAGNALMDGELWLGSRVVNRIIEIQTEWGAAGKRSAFMDFWQHNTRFDVVVEFNGSKYYGSCVLHEAYDAEQHEGQLYSGSAIDLSLYFDDPHLYTDTLYSHQIGYKVQYNAKFYTDPARHADVIPPGSGYIHYFSIFHEAQEYLVNNPSSTPNGVEITITAERPVVNPAVTNITSGQTLQFDLTMNPEQVLYINTQPGFIRATLDGADVLRKLTLASRMIQVLAGDNVLRFIPDSGSNNAKCRVTFRGKVLAI